MCEDHSPVIELEDALLEAAEFGHLNCLKVLLEAGVDVDGTGSGYAGYEDITALMNASGMLVMIQPFRKDQGRCEDCVKLLIEAGADVNRYCEEGTTAIMAPAAFGDTRVVKMLLKAGSHVNDMEMYGNTALSLASNEIGNKTCIKILLAAGADRDLKNDKEIVYLYERKCTWGEFFDDADLKSRDNKITKSLKHQCRKKMRKHLLQMSPVNLFCQVPKLGLPNLLTQYLLYNMSLEIEEEEAD